MPEVSTLKELAEFLREYGGWALSVLLMFAIIYLHRSMSDLLEKRNSQLVNLLTECKSVVAENKVFMDRVEDSVEQAMEVIKKNTDVLERVKLLLEDFRR